jgi:gentisate 1,2-dioxygenase
VRLVNRSARAPAFLFVADETPLHRKLGLFEQRA